MTAASYTGVRSAAVLLWLGAAGIVCAPAGAQEGPVVARAAGVSGHCLLSTSGAPAISLTRGYVLNPGDLIDTRGGGRVVIDLSDGSMVVVQPESLLVLKDYRQASSLRELFEITVGQVRVKINHFAGRPNPYRMNSPTASIAVRGTEFTITVDAQGGTEVAVIEGLVEVSSLSDPSRRVLIEAGRAVRVGAGQDFHLINPAQAGRAGDRDDGGRDPGDRDSGSSRDRRDGGPPRGDGAAPRNDPAAPRGDSGPSRAPSPENRPPFPDNRGAAPDPRAAAPALPGADPRGGPGGPGHGDRDDFSPRAAAGTYQRYIAALSEIGQIPFLLRFNAFPESHLDSLENPAYAGQFRSGEARLFVLPTFSGLGSFTENTGAFGARGTAPASYSISPQLSVFVPLKDGRTVLGGSLTASRFDSGLQSGADSVGGFGPGPSLPAASLNSTGASTSRYVSGSLLAARRLGERDSLGFEVERLHGTGTLWHERVDQDPDRTQIDRTDTASDITQTRLTAGWEHALGRGHTAGIFYRYGLIEATDGDLSHTLGPLALPLEFTNTAGHSSEFGMRVRGPLTGRLFYGVTASWLGLSLNEGLTRLFTVDSLQRDRGRRGTLGLGLGYVIGRRTVVSFDLAGGTSRAEIARGETATGALLETGNGTSRFVSTHTAVQSDLWKGLFLSASILTVAQTHDRGFSLFPDSTGRVSPVASSFLPFTASLAAPYASDYGVGWRFSPNFFAQYVYSTDYGTSSPTHTIMLRYTFHFHKE